MNSYRIVIGRVVTSFESKEFRVHAIDEEQAEEIALANYDSLTEKGKIEEVGNKVIKVNSDLELVLWGII